MSTNLTVYNLTGQQVGTLVNGFLPAGLHDFHWIPAGLSSGLYFLRAETPTGIKTVKLQYLK